MKNINWKSNIHHKNKHKRILKQVRRGNENYRVRVTKTNAHIYAQLLDDINHKTIVSSSSLQLKLSNGNVANCRLVGLDLAKKMNEKNITKVSFDRGWAKYHGRVSAIANALRENNIKV